ncbi:MAG: hypothetical protein LBJ93_00765 [Clostridiales bacterium]|jgi:hypothetical protein|nr:hypothetical protein [Clostridiales bacterium]
MIEKTIPQSLAYFLGCNVDRLLENMNFKINTRLSILIQSLCQNSRIKNSGSNEARMPVLESIYKNLELIMTENEATLSAEMTEYKRFLKLISLEIAAIRLETLQKNITREIIERRRAEQEQSSNVTDTEVVEPELESPEKISPTKTLLTMIERTKVAIYSLFYLEFDPTKSMLVFTCNDNKLANFIEMSKSSENQYAGEIGEILEPLRQFFEKSPQHENKILNKIADYLEKFYLTIHDHSETARKQVHELDKLEKIGKAEEIFPIFGLILTLPTFLVLGSILREIFEGTNIFLTLLNLSYRQMTMFFAPIILIIATIVVLKIFNERSKSKIKNLTNALYAYFEEQLRSDTKETESSIREI